MRDQTEKPVFPHRLSSVVQVKQAHSCNVSRHTETESGNTTKPWRGRHTSTEHFQIISFYLYETLEGEQDQCNLPTKWRT